MRAIIFIEIKEGYMKGEIKMRKASKVTSRQMDIIATYMDDNIREKVHGELAPCNPEDFLRRYCELDSAFETTVLNGE